jgi:signal transduction histidine kinase
VKPQLVAILLLLVCLPLGLLVWVGEERTRGAQERARASLETVLQDRLLEIDNRLNDTILQVEATVGAALARLLAPPPGLTPRSLAHSRPLINQVFMGTADGQRIHPPQTNLTANETAFLDRLGSMSELLKNLGSPRGESGSPTSAGWHTWYHGEGRHFIYWQRDSSGNIAGCEVDRMAFLSKLIQDLPTDRLENGRIVLRDEAAYPIYQWGNYEPDTHIQPIVEVPTTAPIESWRLAYFVPEETLAATPASRTESFFRSILIAVGGLVLLLGGYFYRANTQALKEAAQRVSFVNQVSHELKTPLTNIRMYAELAEGKLDPDDKETHACLEVVVAESGRLSRLIQNVLTFAKQQRGTVSLHATSVSPDEIIRSIVETFEPSLAEGSFKTSLELESADTMRLDRDVVEQILSNLVSNVLKYAAEGKSLNITSRRDDDCVTIDVADRGPGIPTSWQRRVFAPFVRMSDRVTDGVAGTGIGLSIARELAESHEGNLSVQSSDEGATFTLTLTEIHT